ncbi:hypothetical protein J1614_010944 [Plenodomus biglobosus]|nr:hypothetical protein J1614_010944 [Plenodomus biglobosus]
MSVQARKLAMSGAKDELVQSDAEVLPEHVKREIHTFAEHYVKDSEALYRSVAGKLKLKPETLGDLSEIDHSQLEEMIEKAIKKGENMKAARNRSLLKKSGKHLVDFAHNLRGLLVGYAEMKAIISGIGPPFSQIAYGGLHVLLQIGIHKIQREDAIKDTLHNLSMVMPRMRQYHVSLKSHREEDLSMWKHLVSLYIAAMKFPVAAIKYYTQSSIKRNMRLLYKPGQLVKETADEIARLIDSVDQEAIGAIYVRQLQQIDALELVANDAKRAYHTLEQIQLDARAELRKTKEDQHRSNIRQLLRCFMLSDRDNAAPTRQDLAKLISGAFVKAPRKPGRKDKRLLELTFDGLLQLAEYTRWKDSSRSSLLVLSGSNYDDHHARNGLCWLSSAITEVAANLDEKYTTVYCPRRVDRYSSGSARRAILTAIFQLMDMDMRLCGEMFDFIQSNAYNKVWSEAPINELIEHMRKVIERSSAEAIFLLFDRIDILDDASPKDFIIFLLRLVRLQEKVVKVLVTVDGAGWTRDEALLASNNGEALRDDLSEDQLILKLQWAQTEFCASDGVT